MTAVGGKSLEEEYRERLQSWAFCAVTDSPMAGMLFGAAAELGRMCGRDPHVDIARTGNAKDTRGRDGAEAAGGADRAAAP